MIAKTVEAFKLINPDFLVPAHCTGWNTIFAFQKELPKRFAMPSTGTLVIFGG